MNHDKPFVGSDEAYRNAPYWKLREPTVTEGMTCAGCGKRLDIGTTCAVRDGKVMHAACYFRHRKATT